MLFIRSLAISSLIAMTMALTGCSNSSSPPPTSGTGGNAGSASKGGATTSGGSTSQGGTNSSGGTDTVGGATSKGGSMSSGGSTNQGGSVGVGGTTVQGGTSSAGGSTVNGGATVSSGGTPSTGGAVTSGGTTSLGGTTGGGSNEGPCAVGATKWTGSPSRPQLTEAAAGCFTIKRYLGTTGAGTSDNWDPTLKLEEVATFKATFTVASDGSGTHTSVQEAVTAATGTARVYILVKPGTYREPVCVNGTVPITLYGEGSDASKVTIAYDNYNSKSVSGAKVNPCQPASGTFGTTTSSTFFVKSNEFQAINLTIANDYAEPGNGTAQAVAMTTHGDKLVFQNVRFIGNQDTLQPGSSKEGVAARAYYKSCYVEGDTDFIFGSGQAVFDDCKITYIGTRKTGGGHLAPSTSGALPYGILIINSHIVSGPGSKSGGTTLGRAWNVSGGANPNGQVVIRDTIIDDHVKVATPWNAATGSNSNPFDADKNRLFEYKNTGAGAAK